MRIEANETKTSVKKLFHIYVTSTPYGLGRDNEMVETYIFRLKKFKATAKNKRYILSHEFEVVEYVLKFKLPDKYSYGTQYYYWIGIPEIDFCISSGEKLFYESNQVNEIPIEIDFDCAHSADIFENAAFMANYIREIKLKDILE
jgi:hypothetical protein